MSADAVARALMAMDDAALRARVAAGDFSGIDDDALDDEERRLLSAAAAAVPGDGGAEVEGFAGFAPPYVPVGPVVGGDNLRAAVQYAKGGIVDTQLASKFNRWAVTITAQGDW